MLIFLYDFGSAKKWKFNKETFCSVLFVKSFMQDQPVNPMIQENAMIWAIKVP